MKKTKLNCLVALVCAAATFSAFTVSAEVSSKAIEQKLSAVRPPELPATAASLVKKAKAEEQQETTVAVVKAAIHANASSAAAVVGAISKAAPKMAATAAATAVSLEPKQAAKIARAAASGAPAEADQIVAAMTKENSSLSNIISQAVASTLAAQNTIAQFQRPPTQGPPFVERTGTSGDISTTNTIPLGPDDTRDYSAP